MQADLGLRYLVQAAYIMAALHQQSHCDAMRPHRSQTTTKQAGAVQQGSQHHTPLQPACDTTAYHQSITSSSDTRHTV
jgi:hypothetical protein